MPDEKGFEGLRGERLAALETEIRLIRETLSVISKTLDRQSDQATRIANAEKQTERLEADLKAMDTDMDLKDTQLAELRLNLETFKAYIKARDWFIAGLATVGASIGGYLLQVIITTIF